MMTGQEIRGPWVTSSRCSPKNECTLWVKSKLQRVRLMSALPPKADIDGNDGNVRFVPKADILRCGKQDAYSITSSARASNVGGTWRPSALAVLTLIAR